jgi:hypothetical protein
MALQTYVAPTGITSVNTVALSLFVIDPALASAVIPELFRCVAANTLLAT